MNYRTQRISVLSTALSSDSREAVQRARTIRFSGLMFEAYSPTLSLPDLSQTGRREFRHLLGSQQIELVGLRGDIGAAGFGTGADVDRLIRNIDRAMEAAAGLGAPLLCLEIGPLAEPAQEAKTKPTITPEQAGLILIPAPEPARPVAHAQQAPVSIDTKLLASVNSAMAEVAARADRYSVVVAISSALASFAAVEQVIQSARCPWFGIDLDPVNMLRDAWMSDEIFSSLGSLIRHVRVRDALRGSDHRERPVVVGHGNVDWPALLARLDGCGYQGWFTVDPMELSDRPRAAGDAFSLLRSL